MTWASITLRWPEQATQFLGDLAAAKELAGSALEATGQRLTALAEVATVNPGSVGAAAGAVVASGRAALAGVLGEAPQYLAVTPFQSGIGQGRGHQRYLSAPNLLQHLGAKLLDASDGRRPTGEQHALVVLFLATRFDQLADTLARFNALLPAPDLVRAERRARHLSRLEQEKWEMPSAGPLPRWRQLPLERCPVTRAASQAVAGQLAALEGYAANSSPMAELGALASRKAEQRQAREQQLAVLQAQLTGGAADVAIRARLLGPGDPLQLRNALLEDEAPGHEWVLSAGVMLVGSQPGLSFVRELVGL